MRCEIELYDYDDKLLRTIITQYVEMLAVNAGDSIVDKRVTFFLSHQSI